MNRSMSVIKRRYRYSKLIHCLSECEVVTEDRDCRVNGDIMKRGLLDKLETDLPGVYDVDSDLKIDLIKSACDKYLKCCPINVAMKVAGQFDGIWAPRRSQPNALDQGKKGQDLQKDEIYENHDKKIPEEIFLAAQTALGLCAYCEMYNVQASILASITLHYDLNTLKVEKWLGCELGRLSWDGGMARKTMGKSGFDFGGYMEGTVLEDTLEIAEITRKKMNDKMKNLECVQKKVKIIPPDYSKENYLATFTPQKQLTPEQIFWSQDLIKMKAKALKTHATASRPIKVLTVYPPNTPATLVPRVLPTTRVNNCTDASRSQPRSNTKKNRILPAKSVNMKKVEEHPRTIKSSLKTTNRVDSSISSKRTVTNSNSHSVFQTCNKCLISANHDMCVVTYLHSMNASPSVKNVVRKVKQVWKPKQVKQVWKPTGNILTTVGDRSQLRNFVKKFTGTVRFRNDYFGAIMGYGDYIISESVISRVYYVEGLGHNLFTIGQFCDSDLEVAFRKHSYYVRDTDDVELIKGSRGSNLYTISIEDMLKSSPICLLSKASKNKSWLWHQRLNHLNFGKSKKHTHKPKTENSNLEVLNTLHMDLYGPVPVQTINGKKYILVIVDDYSRFTWVKFLRSKDETLEVVIQVGLNKTVRNIRTDNGTEFVNKDLTDYYERVRIFHQKTAPMFLWAEAVATACYTQNRSLIHTRHCKTPYELVHDKKPTLTFFKVFGALCYPTNDSKDLGKLQPTTDIGIFIGYEPSMKGYRIYNKRTRRIMETIHIRSGLVPNPVPAAPYVPPTNKDLEILFQPMFDEYLEPPRIERPVSPAPALQVPVNSTSTPSSTTIDQDAPSPSHSPSSSALQSPSLHQGVAAESPLMKDNPFAPINNDHFINVFAPEPRSEASSFKDFSSTESPYVSQILHHLRK
ncbi:retrovirus-related pol polyprotein from transposon TNT 1-94 [Tanacetum coccineum]